ncbi:MAG: histidine phosphatase family protein [Pigmentiphaga sp.]|nr:histidine phosphatase family protein [Pigmentiphaga sp.]
MNLFLWRHAEAEDGSNDLARALTARGREQAAHMARWLSAFAPADLRILVSPAVRTRQTADALGLSYEVVESLAPGASPATVLTEAQWPTATSNVLVVGHQPTLGMAAALALTGHPLSWSVRKGGIWWLANRQRDDDHQVVVRAVVTPETV